MKILRTLALGSLAVMVAAMAAPALAAGPEADHGTEVAVSPPVGTMGAVVTLNDPWVALPDLPVALSRSAGAVVDGRFFVIGGEPRDGYVQEYDPVAGTWDNTNAVMPTPASNLCAAVIGTEIFIPGGWTGTDRLTDLQVYDTATDTWQTVASDPLPAGRMASACTAYGGKIYVFGGNDDSDSYVNTTYIYDPAAAAGSRWTTGAPAPIDGGYGNAIAAGGYIFWAGMRNTTADLADVFRYDPADDSWVAMPSLTTARGAAQVWTYDGKLAVGGGGWSSYLDSVEEYDLSQGTTGTWTAGNSLVAGRRTFAAGQDDANLVLYAAAGWNGAFMAAAEASEFDPPAPEIDVDPLSLASSQLPDTVTDHTLTISNTGDADLEWEIFEELTVTGMTVPIGPLAPPIDADAVADDEAAGIEFAVSPTPGPANRTARLQAKQALLSTGLLLVPDSTNDRIMALDPVTGDVIDPDFVPSEPIVGTGIHAILNAAGDRILLSDQIGDVVHEFDLAGNYIGIFAPAGGANTAILDNIRGMALRPNGNLLVSVASGGNAHAVAEFDTDGNYVGNFVANNAGGLASPWGIIARSADWLVGGITSTAIHRYDLTGSYIDDLASVTSFPQQLFEIANGNILIGNFSGSQTGVVELTSAGALVGVYNPGELSGYRGVYELPNGNILTTTGTGVHEIDRSGNLVESKITGVSARMIQHVTISSTLCTDLSDVPWLSTAPSSGTTGAGLSTNVTVSLDSTGLTPDVYTANLCVFSNDPDPGPGNGTDLVVVPVTLEVTEPPAPAISLSKTVGTEPGVCAATTEITVIEGTEVHYCFVATNTGNVTLELHDLVDSELGAILDEFPFSLAPGASSTEVIVPATPADTVTNTATWTAYNAGPTDVATAQASATVTVEEEPTVTVTVVVGPGGGGSVSGGGVFEVGEEVTVTATPNPGWIFLHWLDNGTEIPDNPYTFEVTVDVTLTAVFEQQEIEAIPTAGTVGLVLLLVLLAGAGVIVLRRM